MLARTRSPAASGEAVAAVPFGSASLPGGAGRVVGTASAARAVAAHKRTITQAEIAGRRRRCMARNLLTENGFGQCVRASFTRGDDGVIRFWTIVHVWSPGMPRPRLFDEDEVLERAMRTFWA